MKITKDFFLTITYLIVLYLILTLNNLAFQWLTIKVIAPIFEWFYVLDWFWKILILVFGGISIITIFYSLLTLLGTIVNMFLGRVFPYNKVTLIGSIILCLINITILEILAWKLPKYDFWLFGLWLIIAYVIVQMNWVFIYQPKSND
ncbi:hypothetical protein AB3G33_02985 [Flavobacterium sp. WC2421]|uniref:hypothetical protein n=1 Tax=Flavobacterium sp. WC2421 TaxID=3234138 RepID=UPI0034655111